MQQEEAERDGLIKSVEIMKEPGEQPTGTDPAALRKADDHEEEKDSSRLPQTNPHSNREDEGQKGFPFMNRIILGDCLEKLKEIPDNSVDLIATDPPYGLEFMGKDWDKAVPKVEVWKECRRVLKPGAFAFIMCSPRQDCLSKMITSLAEAGFQTNFTSLYWTYASGFPKALNISKAIDKNAGAKREAIKEHPLTTQGFFDKVDERGKRYHQSDGQGVKIFEYQPITRAATQEAAKFEGAYGGFQPKPAVEVIIVVMKPMDEKTYVGQALKNGKGTTWMDEGRIPYADAADKETYDRCSSVNGVYETGLTWAGKKVLDSPKAGARTADYFGKVGEGRSEQWTASELGRFPANLAISDEILDDGKRHPSSGIGGRAKHGRGEGYGFNPQGPNAPILPKDKGGYSRFFSLDAWAEKNLPPEILRNLPFLIVPKASKKEKNAGLDMAQEKTVGDGRRKANDTPFQRGKSLTKNTHPTVKPIKLMAYLITLASREGEIVLDPFVGSGSTCIAAKILKRRFIGIELDENYHGIAEARLENAVLAKAA
jgi:DNA modification methylase